MNSDDLVRERFNGADVLSYPHRLPTIVHALDNAVLLWPHNVMFESDCFESDCDNQPTVTYTEFADMVEGAAQWLKNQGLRPGDRFAGVMHNGLDIMVAIWACARAELIFVGLSPRLQPAQWTFMLQQSGASLAVAHPEFLDGMRDAGKDAGLDASDIREVGDSLTGNASPWKGDAIAFPDQDRTYMVIYTSGTTGRPKASQVVHRCTMHSSTYYVQTFALTPQDRTAISFPLHYITGHVTQVTPTMLTGGTVVPVKTVSAHELVRVLRDKKITFMCVVPSLWPMLLRESEFTFDKLPDLVIGAMGGSPMPLSSVVGLRRKMPQLRLFDLYGLTETHSPATCLYDHEFRRKSGSVGKPISYAEFFVVDDNGNDVSRNDPGELWIKGPMITPGYFNDDAATKAAITDGWLHTGDYGRIDEEGYVYLLDRKKDMITRGGFKIYSVELEYLLVRHPAIEQAAVFGIPSSDVQVEAVCAYVVPATNASITATDVQRWVKENMADYAVPRHVRIVSEIPRNLTGKIDKTMLRDSLMREGPAGRDKTV